MSWVYCDWNGPYGERDGEPYSEDEARARYAAGQRVTLLVGDLDKPEQVAEIELGGRVCDVAWLDALQRPELQYVFAVREDGGPDWPQDQLLLEQVRIREYDHDERPPDDTPSRTESYHFKPDRRYFGRRQAGPGADLEETEGVLDPDAFAVQLEPVPAFGAWDSLLRRER